MHDMAIVSTTTDKREQGKIKNSNYQSCEVNCKGAELHVTNRLRPLWKVEEAQRQCPQPVSYLGPAT